MGKKFEDTTLHGNRKLLDHCAVNFQIVDSNLTHTRVFVGCFASESPLYVPGVSSSDGK